MERQGEMKIRAWAYANAYSLIFASIMFFITWVVICVAAFTK